MRAQVQQGLVLGMSTLAFTVCFMVWMMFAVLGVPIKELLALNETQFGLLAATPVLTGSLVRLPLGLLTDRFGGRIVFFLLMLACVLPLYLITLATAFWQFLVLGLFVGLAGGSFSVGIAYVAKWFDKQNQGFAMGVFGAGNAGAAVTKFLAPALIAFGTWHLVPKVFSAILFITALLFWFLTTEKKEHSGTGGATLREQLKTLKEPAVWRYCQYYSIVFGGYVALALWMTKYYVQEYGFSLQSAALLAACFSLPGGVLRAVGGWMSDRWGAQSVTWWVLWVSWICLFLLSYPQTQRASADRQRHRRFPHWSQPHAVHRAAVRDGHCLRVRQGLGLQIHRQRLPEKHGRGVRHRRPGRRPGRVRAADHVRRPGGPHRRALVLLHVDVRRGLGLPGLDVLQRNAQAPAAG